MHSPRGPVVVTPHPQLRAVPRFGSETGAIWIEKSPAAAQGDLPDAFFSGKATCRAGARMDPDARSCGCAPCARRTRDASSLWKGDWDERKVHFALRVLSCRWVCTSRRMCFLLTVQGETTEPSSPPPHAHSPGLPCKSSRSAEGDLEGRSSRPLPDPFSLLSGFPSAPLPRVAGPRSSLCPLLTRALRPPPGVRATGGRDPGSLWCLGAKGDGFRDWKPGSTYSPLAPVVPTCPGLLALTLGELRPTSEGRLTGLCSAIPQGKNFEMKGKKVLDCGGEGSFEGM